MYAEGDTELRSLIVQSLESSGFLNKIKAELRAGVFLAFEEEGSLRKKIPLFNKTFDDFIGTSNGKLILSLVREFLDFFNLNFTLSVFDPEVASDTPCFNRSELCAKFNIKNSELDGPVISALLKSKLSPESGKPSVNQNSEAHVGYGSTTITKSLETISEDFPLKEKSLNDTFMMKEDGDVSLSSTFTLKETTENNKSSKKSILEPSVSLSNTSKNHTPMIESLQNEFGRLDNKEETKIGDIFGNDKPGASDILKEIMSSSSLDHDPFFDQPLPSEKQSLFDLPKEKGSKNFKKSESSQNDGSSNLFGTEKSTLSSLKDLPSLTTSKSKDWTFTRDLPKATLPGLDSGKPLPPSSKPSAEEIDFNDVSKKIQDPESNEESSDKQANSEESIEEDLEEDFSGGLEDLLNSSLSLGDDATSDQSVSQVSVVDGVDHIEPCNTVK